MTNDYLRDLDDWDNESQQILLSLAKNNEFISFEEMEKGVLGKVKNVFEGIRTNKTFQEISNEIAMESPFRKQSIFYNYFVTISNPKDKEIKDEKKFYTNFIACKSGSEVFERYNDDQNIADNEMNIYCEEEKTGKSNFFGTVCRVRIGKGFREILDRNNFNIFITNFNTTTTSLNDFVSKIAASHEISSSLLEIAIRIEFLEKNEFNQAYQQVAKLNNSVAEFLQSGVEVLDTYKLTDVNYDYEKYFLNLRNTTAQNYPYKPLLPIKAFMTEQDRMYSKNARNFITTGLKSLTSFLGTFEELITGVSYYLLKKTKEFSQDVAEAIILFAKEQLEKIIPESIKTIFKRLKNCLVKIVNVIDNAGQLVKNKLGHDLAMANAFLCGLVNGLISLVQTILMLLAFVVDKIPLLEVEKMTPSELVKHQEKLEFVEDTIDLLEERVPHLIDAIKVLVTDNKIWRELTSFCKLLKDKIANLNQYFWMFFVGAVTFEILLEVIIAILTAGSGNVVSLSSKISRISAKAEQLATKTANFVGKLTPQVKNSLNQLIKWLKKEFEELIEAVKSGKFVDYVKEKFYRLIDDQDGLRKIYLNKWLHKFDENFVNHLSGDVEFISQKVFNKKWLKYEEWIYLGRKGQGGHLMNKFVRIDEIIYPKNTYSMLQIADDIPFKAKVTIKSLNGKLFPKLAESSIFPKNWDVKRIQEEIAYVYEKAINDSSLVKIKATTTKLGRMEAECSSGFKIRIEFDMEKNILNAYPVIN